MRRQVTIQIDSGKRPLLFSRYFTDDGERIDTLNASQDIPELAERYLASEAVCESEVMEALTRIEDMIRNLRNVGLIDDDQEIEMKKRASNLIGGIPISR